MADVVVLGGANAPWNIGQPVQVVPCNVELGRRWLQMLELGDFLVT